MKTCPYCNKDIKQLGVVVQATLTLDPINGFSSVQEVEDTLGYYCTECGATLDFEKAAKLADEMFDAYELPY